MYTLLLHTRCDCQNYTYNIIQSEILTMLTALSMINNEIGHV